MIYKCVFRALFFDVTYLRLSAGEVFRLAFNKHSKNFHLDAGVDKNNLKRASCMKKDRTSEVSRPDWPKGISILKQRITE